MNSSRASITKTLLVAALLPVAGTAAAVDLSKLPPRAKYQVDVQGEVQPLLERCQLCHGEQQQMSGFRLDRREDALRGGYSGAVIIPGNSAESRLIHLVAGLEEDVVMPPDGDRLATEEIGVLRAWIDQGARWPQEAGIEPRDGTPESAQTKANSQTQHWSFRPIERPAVPKVHDSAWVRNPIDAFVLAKLESKGIQPSPEAERRKLVRRAYLDLIGLPPSPQSVAEVLEARAGTPTSSWLNVCWIPSTTGRGGPFLGSISSDMPTVMAMRRIRCVRTPGDIDTG